MKAGTSSLPIIQRGKWVQWWINLAKQNSKSMLTQTQANWGSLSALWTARWCPRMRERRSGSKSTLLRFSKKWMLTIRTSYLHPSKKIRARIKTVEHMAILTRLYTNHLRNNPLRVLGASPPLCKTLMFRNISSAKKTLLSWEGQWMCLPTTLQSDYDHMAIF